LDAPQKPLLSPKGFRLQDTDVVATKGRFPYCQPLFGEPNCGLAACCILACGRGDRVTKVPRSTGKAEVAGFTFILAEFALLLHGSNSSFGTIGTSRKSASSLYERLDKLNHKALCPVRHKTHGAPTASGGLEVEICNYADLVPLALVGCAFDLQNAHLL
jgi:hypothetical protein